MNIHPAVLKLKYPDKRTDRHTAYPCLPPFRGHHANNMQKSVFIYNRTNLFAVRFVLTRWVIAWLHHHDSVVVDSFVVGMLLGEGEVVIEVGESYVEGATSYTFPSCYKIMLLRYRSTAMKEVKASLIMSPDVTRSPHVAA
jgi:hypothetical protein